MPDVKKTIVMVPKRARTPTGRIIACANNSGAILPKCPDEFAPFFEFLDFCDSTPVDEVSRKDRLDHEKSIVYYYSALFPAQLKGAWESNIRMATFASVLTKFLDRNDIDPTKAFATGLFQDIGRLVIHYAFADDDPDKLDEIRQGVEDGSPLHDAEYSALGTDHCEIGAKLLEDWKAPEWLYQSVRHHNSPDFSNDIYLSLGHIAGRVSNNLTAEDPIASVDPSCLKNAGLEEEFTRKFALTMLEHEQLLTYFASITPGQQQASAE